MKESEGTLAVKLCRVLYKYRVTPHSTTQETPAKLLMGRHLKTPLDLLRPNLKLRVEEHQRKQKVWHDTKASQRSFEIGDLVYARNFGRGEVWLPAKVVSKSGPLSYVINWDSSGYARRHVDQLRKRIPANESPTSSTPPIYTSGTSADASETDSCIIIDTNDKREVRNASEIEIKRECPSSPVPEPVVVTHGHEENLRRSTRARKPPDRLITLSA